MCGVMPVMLQLLLVFALVNVNCCWHCKCYREQKSVSEAQQRCPLTGSTLADSPRQLAAC